MAPRCSQGRAEMGRQVLFADARHAEGSLDSELWRLRAEYFRLDAQSPMVSEFEKVPITSRASTQRTKPVLYPPDTPSESDHF